MEVKVDNYEVSMTLPSGRVTSVEVEGPTFMVCDNCVVGSQPWLTETPHGTTIQFKGLPIEDALVKYPGLRAGKLEDALQNGWVETDFGFVCPTCQAELDGHDSRIREDEVEMDIETNVALTESLLAFTMRKKAEENE